MSTSLGFSGVSSYASDFQKVIDRSLSIAALPLQQLGSQLQKITAQQSALNDLDSKFSALQTALNGISGGLGSKSYVATSSQPSAVTASVSSGALEGTYTIDVSSLGSFSTSISDASLPSVADPYSTSISSAVD